LIIVAGALAAALAGASVGAQTRPAAPVGPTLGPRMDFDLATHAPATAPPRPQLAAGFPGAPTG
jgi:hypothetical protein